MIKILLILFNIIVAFSIASQGQDSTIISEAKIVYERTENYVSIISKLNIMTREEIDRMDLTWGSRRRGSQGGMPYVLIMNEKRSFYTYAEDEVVNSNWRRSEFWSFRDIEAEERIDLLEFGGQNYIVKDEWKFPKWKILDKIKDVNGYVCMLAETKDPVKNQVIHAWFTDEIPYQFGPEGYGGLPGVILEIEINGGDAIITATSINLNYVSGEISLPKKMKGKNQTLAQYSDMAQKYIFESIQAKRNPYWNMRY